MSNIVDIRMETYKEALSSYLKDSYGNIEAVGNPDEEIAKHNLASSKNVNTTDYPPGTWFYYPAERAPGECYVREA